MINVSGSSRKGILMQTDFGGDFELLCDVVDSFGHNFPNFLSDVIVELHIGTGSERERVYIFSGIINIFFFHGKSPKSREINELE